MGRRGKRKKRSKGVGVGRKAITSRTRVSCVGLETFFSGHTIQWKHNVSHNCYVMWRTDNRDMSFTIVAFSALVRRDLSSSLFASLVLPPVPWQTPPDDSLHPLTILCSVQVQKLLLYTAGWLILPLPIKNIAHRLYMFLPLNQWKTWPGIHFSRKLAKKCVKIHENNSLHRDSSVKVLDLLINSKL